MIRIKTLGLALLAALSLCAVAGASTASAGYYAVSAGVTGYTGTPGEQYFTLGSTLANCTTESLSGTVSNGDKSLAPATPDMSCKTKSETISWKYSGCKLTFSPGAEGAGTGAFAIGPAGCGPITLTEKNCTRYVGAQGGTATYTNQSGVVKISISQALLSTTVAKQSLSCQPEEMSYTGSWTIVPFSGTLEAISGRIGFFLGGSGFAAENYPVSLSGTQDAGSPNILTRGGSGSYLGYQFTCSQVELSSLMTGTASELSLAPKYVGCQAKKNSVIQPAELDARSCRYTVASSGVFGVSCSEVGDSIKITTYADAAKQSAGIPLCILQIPPQTAKGAVGLSAFGEGQKRGVAVAFSANTVTSEKIFGLIPNCGEKSETIKFGGATNIIGSLG